MSPDIDTVVVNAHRRWGKDELCLHATAIHSMQRVGSYLTCLPQYSQARKALWQGVNARTGRTRVSDAFPPEVISKKDDKSMLIETLSKSTIQLVGSDQPDSLVGGGIVGLVMSEAALSNPAAFSFLRPMLVETKGRSAHISSPRGRNHFYKLYNAHKDNPRSFVTTLSAEDTGVFTAAQLKAERHAYVQEHGVAMGEALFFQEYYASWDAAIVGGVWTAELAKLKKAGRYAPCQYDPRYPVATAWDLGVADPTCILFMQEVGSEVRLIDYYESNNTGLEHYVKVLQDKGYLYSVHIGPHDIANREWGTGTSRIEQAARLGLHFKRANNTPKSDQIALGSQLINRMVINSSVNLDTGDEACARPLECFEQYHFEYDELNKVASGRPKHDWSSHMCDALMTYAIYNARNVSFARPSESVVPRLDPVMPRLSSIMAQRNRPSGAIWG
jgi:hypothetical protein